MGWSEVEKMSIEKGNANVYEIAHTRPKNCSTGSHSDRSTHLTMNANIYEDFFDRLLSTYCTEGLIGLSVR
jgi:hypothetical protein